MPPDPMLNEVFTGFVDFDRKGNNKKTRNQKTKKQNKKLEKQKQQ